jgi:hypothetical protein
MAALLVGVAAVKGESVSDADLHVYELAIGAIIALAVLGSMALRRKVRG